jgi:hypothetical protein
MLLYECSVDMPLGRKFTNSRFFRKKLKKELTPKRENVTKTSKKLNKKEAQNCDYCVIIFN